MAERIVELHVQSGLPALGELIKVATTGLDGRKHPDPPERLVVVGRPRYAPGRVCAVHIAPSPELLRWLADAVEANPTFAA